MMNKKVRTLLLMFALSLALSGCEAASSPIDLLTAPRLDEAQQKARAAIIHTLPDDAALTLPVQSERTSAINLVDLDGDGIQEAIAFYQKQQTSEVGMLIMVNESGTWKKASSLAFQGTAITYAAIQDLDGNERPELLVGVDESSYWNTLSIYQFKNKEIKRIDMLTYTEVAIGNLNDDPQPEIVALTHDQEKGKAKAQVYTIKNQRLHLIDQLAMNGAMNGYEQVLIGNAAQGQKGVFVDMGIGAHSSYTALLVLQNNRLHNVVATPEDETAQTYKPHSLYSKDINGDGIIEIGIQQEPPGSEDMPLIDVPWIDGWYRWDGKSGLVAVHQSYTDIESGYRFHIPELWHERYTVKQTKTEGAGLISTFYYVDATGKITGEWLTIRPYKLAQWTKEEETLKYQEEDYTVVAEDHRHVFVATFPKGRIHPTPEPESIRLTKQNITSYFELFHFD
ncbi:FG-GAP repeat domain-containing protein [Aneurinibacillus sp. REN35]|uniref:FG-GAP repeat domain-containing protein n=1 Tax=Aneurinibacillus sp. REN35 TaxID=3237286 RepID=UPI0035287ADB